MGYTKRKYTLPTDIDSAYLDCPAGSDSIEDPLDSTVPTLSELRLIFSSGLRHKFIDLELLRRTRKAYAACVSNHYTL